MYRLCQRVELDHQAVQMYAFIHAVVQRLKHDLALVPFERSCTKNEKLYFDRRTAWFGLRCKKWWKNYIKNSINEHRPHDVKLKIHISYSQCRRIHKMDEKKIYIRKKADKRKIESILFVQRLLKGNEKEKKHRAHWKQVLPFDLMPALFPITKIAKRYPQNFNCEKKDIKPMKICDHGWQHELIISFWEWLKWAKKNRHIEKIFMKVAQIIVFSV